MKPKKSSEADDQSPRRPVDVMEGDDPKQAEGEDEKETRDRGNVERTRTVSGERDPCARFSGSDCLFLVVLAMR